MSRMNTSIPMMGVVPDFANVLAQSSQAAGVTNDLRRQNALAQMLQENGAGIAAGDTNALNALARFDPQAAIGVQDTRQGMDARALQMDATRQGMDLQMQEWAMRLDDRERAQRLAEGEQVLSGIIAATTPQAWDAMAAQMGKPELVGQFGQRDTMINNMLPPLEALRRIDAQGAQPELPAGAAALEWRAQQAGLQPGTQEYQAFMINGGPPPASSGMRIESNPNGGFTFVQGPGAGAAQEGFQPSDPTLMIQNIDAILNDPALPYATGADAWRAQIPGTDARRVGARMDQLQGQAFLQAFESLKGAGQITEIEGQKATDAIARLDRYQTQEDYVAALMDLRVILEAASQRQPGSAVSPGVQPLPTPVAPQPAPIGQSQFIPSSGVGAPQSAPPVTVNANGPAVTGPITAQTVMQMQPMQLTEFLATTDVSTLPTDVLLAIVERAQ